MRFRAAHGFGTHRKVEKQPDEYEKERNGESPSRLIDARIKELDDWLGKTLTHVRALIKVPIAGRLVARGSVRQPPATIS
jgi:hypothetical protein